MYELLRFLHVLSAMAYFLFHGAVASVTFALRREPVPKTFEVLSAVMVFAYAGAPIAGGVLVLTGIVMGFMGRWWGDRWLWTSLGLLLVIGILMNRLGKPYLTEGFVRASNREAQTQTPTRAGFAGAMRKFFFHPMFFALTGSVGLAVVLWLMMFKPF
jgi:MFS family permease